MTARHTYPFSALAGDYARAAGGMTLTGGPLLLGSPGSVMIWVLGTLAALFAAFGLRTGLRQLAPIELSERGISAAGPFGAAIEWERLSVLRLHYYSLRRGKTRNDLDQGWMQATVTGGGRRIRFDSALGGFTTVVRRIATEAEQRGVVLDEDTRHNLGSLDRMAGAAP
jgi:hypothetical protein